MGLYICLHNFCCLLSRIVREHLYVSSLLISLLWFIPYTCSPAGHMVLIYPAAVLPQVQYNTNCNDEVNA